MTKRIIMGFAAALSVSVSPVYAETTITWIHDVSPERVKGVIEAYEKLNPGIRIDYTQVPFEAFNAQVNARVGSEDSDPDIYGADTPRVPALANEGYLLDLEPYRQEIEAVTGAAGMAGVTYNDRIWAFPTWDSLQVLYYNKALLEAANIEFPGADPDQRLTWEQVVEYAKQAQAAGARHGLVLEQVDRYYQLQPLFESAGAGSGLTGDDLLTPNLLTDEWVETAEWYGRLFSEGLAPRGMTGAQLGQAARDGEIAFYVGGTWNMTRMMDPEETQVDFGIAPIPYFEGGTPVTAIGNWAMGINPYSDNVDAAVDFAKFFSLDPEGVRLYSIANGSLPTQIEGAVEYLDSVTGDDPRFQAAAELIPYEFENSGVSRPRSIGYITFEEIMNRTFADIRNGIDARTALEEAQQQLESSLRRIR